MVYVLPLLSARRQRCRSGIRQVRTGSWAIPPHRLRPGIAMWEDMVKAELVRMLGVRRLLLQGLLRHKKTVSLEKAHAAVQTITFGPLLCTAFVGRTRHRTRILPLRRWSSLNTICAPLFPTILATASTILRNLSERLDKCSTQLRKSRPRSAKLVFAWALISLAAALTDFRFWTKMLTSDPLLVLTLLVRMAVALLAQRFDDTLLVGKLGCCIL